VTDRVHVQEMGQGKSRKPQSYNCRANGNNNLSDTFVFRMCRMTAPDAKALSKQARKQDCAADDKSKPSNTHGQSFYSPYKTVGKYFFDKIFVK
jgi:hypothetical protein